MEPARKRRSGGGGVGHASWRWRVSAQGERRSEAETNRHQQREGQQGGRSARATSESGTRSVSQAHGVERRASSRCAVASPLLGSLFRFGRAACVFFLSSTRTPLLAAGPHARSTLTSHAAGGHHWHRPPRSSTSDGGTTRRRGRETRAMADGQPTSQPERRGSQSRAVLASVQPWIPQASASLTQRLR